MKKEYYEIPEVINASIQDNPFRGNNSSSKDEELACYVGGGGIGNPKTVQEGREMIHTYIVREIKHKIAELQAEIKHNESVLKVLGDDVFNLRVYLKQQ